jgi:hypothetical protein
MATFVRRPLTLIFEAAFEPIGVPVTGVETKVLLNGEPANDGEPRILTATCCSSTAWTPTPSIT